MTLFDKSNFFDDSVNYLEFDDNFCIEVDNSKIKIILGPNGIGKTSLYKNIKERHPEYSYIDYNEVESAMKKNKSTLIIASKIATINEKISERDKILSFPDIEATFKLLDLGSKTKCDKISNKLNDYRKDSNKAFEKFNDDKLDCLFDLDDDLKGFIIKYGKSLIEQTISEAKIEEIKDNYKKKFLEMIDSYLSDDETTCPVCGNECDEPIKEIVSRIIKELKESTNEIVKDYISNNPNSSPQEVLEKTNTLKNVITKNDISIENLENYIICGGSSEKAEFIIQNKQKVVNLNKEIESLESKKEMFYNNLKKIETRIREIFERQLNISSTHIVFDNTNKELKITLERDITEYSTGEINLITFIVTLLEFINSDRNTIIIDDPLSSYDIPNQYKIMYEITNANSNKNNNILILTHNIDCINIAHSQYGNLYEIELMDKVGGLLYLNPLQDLGEKGFHIDYIINKLVGRSDYSYAEYIELLSEKDRWCRTDLRHQLFHYDDYYSVPNSNCNNDELCTIINDLKVENVKNSDSIINSSNKILYLAALRVWIERQFFDHNDDSNGLKKQNYLADKINFMIDGNHWTGSALLEKDYLMSKKVMLNQNDHADSQKEPFYYALSISTDEIVREIIDIKDYFIS